MLQIAPAVQDSIATHPTGSITEPAELAIWELTLKGGWIMIVLALLSVIAIYLFINKLLELRAARTADKSFMDRIKDYISTERIDAAINLCQATDTPSSRIMSKALSRRGRSLNDMMAIIDNAGNVEAGRLQRTMPLIATIAAAAPMIGFLGTVTGMVRAFFDMANASDSLDLNTLSGGIYEALITTVGGLIVGIITLFIYNFLVARIDKVLNNIEATGLELVDYLQHQPREMDEMSSFSE